MGESTEQGHELRQLPAKEYVYYPVQREATGYTSAAMGGQAEIQKNRGQRQSQLAGRQTVHEKKGEGALLVNCE